MSGEGPDLGDLSHLVPLRLEVRSDRVAGGTRPLRVEVRFTSHCTSEAHDPARHGPGAATFADEGGRRRVFDPRRAALSRRLPDLVRSLVHPAATIRQTAERRNWAYVTTLVTEEGETYLAFLHFARPPQRRPGERRADADVVVRVEAAYPRDLLADPPALLGKARFVLVVANTFLGRPTETARGR